MNKIKYLFKRIFEMDYSRMFKTINDVHKKTNKNRIVLFFDIIYCGIRYQAGYVDYALFEMYNLNGKQRKTIITRGINNSFIKKYNDKESMKMLHNKLEFNKKFYKYLKRDWLELTGNNLEEFKKFCKKNPIFVAKPADGSCGRDVIVVDTKDKDMKALYDELYSTQRVLVEEKVIQCDEIRKIHPSSINTLRVVTLKGKVAACYLRIGNNNNSVDNFNHEGLCVPVDIENGMIEYKAIDKKGNLYERHPITNVKIPGIKIPRWNEVKDFCCKAASEIKEVGYIGWDVCITKDDICFIEANEFPGHDVYQLPPHRKDGIGLLPQFEKILKEN